MTEKRFQFRRFDVDVEDWVDNAEQGIEFPNK